MDLMKVHPTLCSFYSVTDNMSYLLFIFQNTHLFSRVLIKITFCISWISRHNGLSVLLLRGSVHHQAHCLHYASIYFHITISFHMVDMREIKYWVALS